MPSREQRVMRASAACVFALVLAFAAPRLAAGGAVRPTLHVALWLLLLAGPILLVVLDLVTAPALSALLDGAVVGLPAAGAGALLLGTPWRTLAFAWLAFGAPTAVVAVGLPVHLARERVRRRRGGSPAERWDAARKRVQALPWTLAVHPEEVEDRQILDAVAALAALSTGREPEEEARALALAVLPVCRRRPRLAPELLAPLATALRRLGVRRPDELTAWLDPERSEGAPRFREKGDRVWIEHELPRKEALLRELLAGAEVGS